nr:TrkA C-terminal domain-containing protein [Thiococcus pfennigii]
MVVTLSILLTRVAAIVLTYTGLSRQTARFQARSAFSGAGFTTAESEQVVNHPVRRRVVLLLMLLGNAGIVTAVSSLILAFVRTGDNGLGLEIKIPLLIGGVVGLWALSASTLFDRLLSRLVERLLARYTQLDVRDYAGLLRLGGDYRIVELAVEADGWLDGRTLAEARPAAEGVLVLGVSSPGGEWLGTPGGETRVVAGDTLVVYGRTEAIESLQQRRKGARAEREHAEAVGKQGEVAARERREREVETGR